MNKCKFVKKAYLQSNSIFHFFRNLLSNSVFIRKEVQVIIHVVQLK